MGPTVSWVFDSTNSAIDSARREKSPASIWIESVLRSRAVEGTRRMWGRELTPKRANEF